MLRRLFRTYEKRLIALRDALNHYRPLSIAIPPVTGGTCYWVRGPDNLDAEQLQTVAKNAGVLIEPATPYFANRQGRWNMFRLGVTSLDEAQIRPGIEALSLEMRKRAGSQGWPATPTLPGETRVLSEAELDHFLSGVQINYETVYGEPCVIELHADGNMLGRAGYAGEDRAKGAGGSKVTGGVANGTGGPMARPGATALKRKPTRFSGSTRVTTHRQRFDCLRLVGEAELAPSNSLIWS